MRVLLAGGGSLGHIAPAVAIGRALRARDPEITLLFTCSDRSEEQAFLKKEELDYATLPLLKRSLLLPIKALRARKEAAWIMDSFRPDVVLSKGGSVSVPIGLSTAKRGTPLILHESDVIPGRATRLLMPYARVICRGFPLEDHEYRDGRQLYTGNPVRPEILAGDRDRGLRIAGLSGERPILLIIGGSQGARALNEIVSEHLKDLLELCDVIHLTGRDKDDRMRNAPGYFHREFAHGDLPHLYAAATLAVSRAGAGAISELAACGIPTILVPLRGVGHDHQLQNAQAAARRGGFLHIEESELRTSIVRLTQSLLSDPRTLEQMRRSVRNLHVPDAAEHIAQIVVDAGLRR